MVVVTNGKPMSKLLNKPLKVFTLYSLVILAASIPVYYLVVDFIWLKELDEHNAIVKSEIENRLKKINPKETDLNTLLSTWNALQPGVKIVPLSGPCLRNDSQYTVKRLNEDSKIQDPDRFRGLICCLQINGNPYLLSVETNVEEAGETVLAISAITFTFFLLLVLGFILLNRRISARIWQPFRDTLFKLRAFDLSQNQKIAFNATDIEEFKELNDALNRLINKNVSVYNQQKTFIENASHELQTPLAVLRSKLNLLLQNENLTNEQAKIISSAEIPLSRVARINKNLLLLAKIGNQQFAETSSVELTSIIDETLLMLSDYIEAEGIILHLDIAHKLKLTCNQTLLEILFNNLIINAILHRRSGNEIYIKLFGQQLTVSNAGDQSLDTDKLFQRFAISSEESASSGLGLSITREICMRYQWQIRYNFEKGMHHFIVNFQN